MAETKLRELIDALEDRVNTLEKQLISVNLNDKTQNEFMKEIQGYIKKFYYSVTISLVAIILWIAKAIVEKAGLGF